MTKKDEMTLEQGNALHDAREEPTPGIVTVSAAELIGSGAIRIGGSGSEAITVGATSATGIERAIDSSAESVAVSALSGNADPQPATAAEKRREAARKTEQLRNLVRAQSNYLGPNPPSTWRSLIEPAEEVPGSAFVLQIRRLRQEIEKLLQQADQIEQAPDFSEGEQTK